MIRQEPKHILLMGLPATGKTSFLAALWYLVQHRQVNGRFHIERLEGDSKYLNQISEAWASYQPVPHTRIDSETMVSMWLRDVRTDQTITLSFPDLSGESFTLQWTTRQLTKGYDSLLQRASCGILFVSPLNYSKPIRVDMADPLVEEIVGQQQEQDPEHAVPTPPKPWNPERAPTQVQLVELLQFIVNREHSMVPFRLAIIVSAWDRLAQLNQAPAQWLSREFPLLQQFLLSNHSLLDSAVYGLSAQGGDYEKDSKALEERIPSERIELVRTNIENVHDLTEPLQWLTR